LYRKGAHIVPDSRIQIEWVIESRNEAKDTRLYVQKGALVSYRAKGNLDDDRRSWMEF
jgi:hypothetical protein